MAWLRLREPMKISAGSWRYAEVLHVTLRWRGLVGFGEGAPLGRYGESLRSARGFVAWATRHLGDDPFAAEQIATRLAESPGEFAAKAALDAALHDLRGKGLGTPVWKMLGAPRTGPPTCRTIPLSDPDTMARRAEEAAPGFGRLKLKLGGGDGLDVERVRAVRQAVRLPLQVDVNEGWSLDEAMECIPQLAAYGVEVVEQPLRAGDPCGESLKRSSAVPVYLDEDCRTLEDIPSCAHRGHGITVKLSKCGGITVAARMIRAAREANLGVMIGCMTESGLGITAASQVAGLCDYVDLDGNLLLKHDPWQGSQCVEGVQIPPDAPGLGVTRAPETVAQTAVGIGRSAYRRSLRPILRRAALSLRGALP